MLDPGSRDALRAVLTRSLQKSLPEGTSATKWELSAVADRKELVEPEFMMLTISAYTFRIVVLLHFAQTRAVETLVSELLKCPAGQLTRERQVDCLAELGNTLSGHLKREVARIHPHLGLSTPNRLSRKTLPHLADLHTTFEAHVRAVRDGTPALASSLLLCSYRAVDFSALRTESAADTGATSTLELF